ncbi:MAG: hypothetical protein FD138_2069 [Planctomycetota bacterium]|nr:MAG: hypothetical protein FD138_2069 [Planctomycetota bacterium]
MKPTALKTVNWIRSATILIVVLTVSSSSRVYADEQVEQRQALLKQMRASVAAIKLREKVDNKILTAELNVEPLFAYSDEQRRIQNATMWVWTVEGRPVTLMKFERYSFPEPQRHWLFNAASISPNLIEVDWPIGREFASKQPGMMFRGFAGTDPASDTKAKRLIQLKQLSRKFSATMTGGATDDAKTEMRLLPTPLFRYSSPQSDILDGALFGLCAIGTNPDAIIAIQWRGTGSSAGWEYGITGMTTGGLQVRLDDTPVWSQPYLVNRGQVFDTWTWFFSDRAE